VIDVVFLENVGDGVAKVVNEQLFCVYAAIPFQ
jgi:hypothetical protein